MAELPLQTNGSFSNQPLSKDRTILQLIQSRRKHLNYDYCQILVSEKVCNCNVKELKSAAILCNALFKVISFISVLNILQYFKIYRLKCFSLISLQ